MSTHTEHVNQAGSAKPSRVQALDLARGLAILFMVIIHILNFYGSAETKQSTIGSTISFIFGWPSASLFIFIMGVFVAYSTSRTLAKGLQRGLELFALGYLLNLTRETIPTLISLEVGLVTYEQLGVYTPLNALLVVDILQCAGIAYAVCFLLKHFIPEPKVWLLVALGVACLSPLLWDIQTGIAWVDQILKIFWGSREQGSLFPVFPWLAYPIVGMTFGHWLRHSSNQEKTFLNTVKAGAALMVIGTIITFTNVEFHAQDKMRPGVGIIVMMTGFVLVWLWLCNLLLKKVRPNPGFKLFCFWSENVTSVYVIHWLYIGWCIMIFGPEQMNLTSTLLMILAVAILSDLTTRVWLKIQKTFLGKKQNSTLEATA